MKDYLSIHRNLVISLKDLIFVLPINNKLRLYYKKKNFTCFVENENPIFWNGDTYDIYNYNVDRNKIILSLIINNYIK